MIKLPMQRLLERYRLPDSWVKFSCDRDLPVQEGFFKFGDGATCFGPCSSGRVEASADRNLHDVRESIHLDGDVFHLPFDPDQVVDNLLLERYPTDASQVAMQGMIRGMYYGLRPLLPVAGRKHLQRIYLSGWEKIPFPHWPVDFTVERILEKLLACVMRAQGVNKIPFIWFWPSGHESCALVTHDVEAKAGRDLCSALMDLDDSCGIKAAFQIIPEDRYSVSAAFLADIRDRGFEVNVHDLNHDGKLFRSEHDFKRRIGAVNRYGKEFRAAGFRAGVMYRNQQWYDALDFEYDMSVPNTARLEPQRGGCCTVMPYFIGKLVELPLTTTQDYALFNFLREYSLELWKLQIGLIRQNHGLISILVHPDYVMERRAREVYLGLLRYISELRDRRQVWAATPGEVNTWWRIRNGLRLVKEGSQWQIEGAGSERARVAYACLNDGTVSYQLEETASPVTQTSVASKE